MKKIKTKLGQIKEWFSASIEKTFSDRKATLKFIALFVFSILFLIEIGIILFQNSFYNNFSDDVLQYYTIMVDFISGLKDGSVSWFNLNNYFGASFFSDVYYIPIDVFTGVTFLLSYTMPIEVAYSATELFKILTGVMLFAYYMSLKGMKTRTIFWMSMIYFISGGTVSFMAFPVFVSLTAYMPMALIVIHYFFKKKRWIVPIFAMASIFYDFYLGYTILAFSCFAFLIEYFKEPDFKFFVFVKEILIFVGLLLLGVVISGVIAYPSIVFILEETYRNTSNFNSYDVTIFGYTLKLFEPNIYIRLLAKIFVEQKPIGFYGFENSYATEHFSLYISIIGFVYMNYIFFMRDKVSRLYKIAIFFAIIFMILPLFSYVFSGTTDLPYTRWINMLPIFQVMILAHVFDRYGFEKVKMKYMSIIIGVLLVLLSFLIYYYSFQIKTAQLIDDKVLVATEEVPSNIKYAYVDGIMVFGDDIPEDMVDDAKRISDYPIVKRYLDEPIIHYLLNSKLSDESKDSILDFVFSIKMISRSNGSLSSEDVLTADTILMGVAGIYLLTLLVFGWMKKWTIVKVAFWVEFAVAIGYIYSGPASISDKINTFQNAHDIEAYLDKQIDDDGFFRVYVDINNLGVEDTNFNRMMGYATNTGIFHSWTDAETNEIGYLLFGSHETQSKNVMNTFGYYLNHFLDYKYILLDGGSDYAFDNEHFILIDSNENYQLYEMTGFSPFTVYESYMSYEDFRSYKGRNSNIATQKLLLMAALIDKERYVEENFNLADLNPDDGDNSITLPSYITVNNANLVETTGVEDETSKMYYQYSNTDLDISYDAGAVYIKTTGLTTDDYGEVFMEFADNSKSACTIQTGQSHQVKCEFWSTPTSIYFEKTDSMYSVLNIQVRQESAINAAAYLVYDLSEMDLPSSAGIMNFKMSSSSTEIEKAFVIDEFGDKHECLNGFYSYSTKPEKIYIFKTNNMYNYSNLFTLSLKVSNEDLSDSNDILNQDFVSDKYLSIENGKINLSYTNNSDSTYDQMVIIPVTYSDDWIFTSDIEYETISASGGFLGIIIPNGTTDIDITMKFVPKGLNWGTYATLGGLLVYFAIFTPYWIKRRKKEVDLG